MSDAEHPGGQWRSLRLKTVDLFIHLGKDIGGQVFGFTHDGSGDVVTIDPKTGKGTLFNSFKDPSTNMGISFAGAGVNPMVSPIP